MLTSTHLSMETLWSLWHCDGLSAGVRHRSRVIYLGYTVVSFLPKLRLMKYTLQDENAWKVAAVTACGVCNMCLMVAGIVGWCTMDQLTEAKFYILEDPGASRCLLKCFSYAFLACYLYPVLLFGHAQLVAEAFLVIVACYYLLWVPLLDSSADTHCCVHAWCLVAFLRLAVQGAELTDPMQYCLKLYLVEGMVLRFLLYRSTRGNKELQHFPKKGFLDAFARPPSSERHTSLEAFDTLFRLVKRDQGGGIHALYLARAVRQSWLHHRSLVRGQMMFTYHCICRQQISPDVIWRILEFVGDAVHSQEDCEDASSQKTTSASSAGTSIEFVKRRLFRFLHQD